MACGHAERNLEAIRLLELWTEELPGSLAQPGFAQSRLLEQAATASSPCPGAPAPDVPGHVHEQGERTPP